MKVQLKNISDDKYLIADLGIELAINEIREIYTDENNFEFSMNEILDSISLQQAVLNDKIIIRNGITDLSKIDSLNFLTGVTLENFYQNNYKEIIRINSKITSIIIWDSSSKNLKYKEYTFTRSNNLITNVNLKVYNSNVLSNEIDYTINRDNNFITNISEVVN